MHPYLHGHAAPVVAAHAARTVDSSAAYLAAHLRPGMRVLDVGCGPGSITLDLAQRVAPGEVVGIDASASVIASARAAAEAAGDSRTRFETADATRLPFDADAFDVVHAHQVLQHVPDPVGVLRELRRVTRPGGLVAVRDSDYEGFRWWPDLPGLSRWRELYLRVARTNSGTPDAGRRLLAWAHAAGFTDVEPSTSTWLYATPESRESWAASWAGRITSPPLAAQLEREGWADEAEREEIAETFRRWSADPDGWFTLLHGEILARV